MYMLYYYYLFFNLGWMPSVPQWDAIFVSQSLSVWGCKCSPKHVYNALSVSVKPEKF